MLRNARKMIYKVFNQLASHRANFIGTKEIRRFPLNKKLRKFQKWVQMVRKFAGKVSRESGNCWVSENWTIHRKFRYTSRVCHLSREFQKWCPIRHWKFPKIQTRMFYRMEITQCLLVESSTLTELVSENNHCAASIACFSWVYTSVRMLKWTRLMRISIYW